MVQRTVFGTISAMTVPVGTTVPSPFTFIEIVSTCSWPRVMVVDENLSVVNVSSGRTVKMKLTEPLDPVVSWAVTVGVEVPPAVGVPEIRPVDALTSRPGGSASTDHVRVWPLVGVGSLHLKAYLGAYIYGLAAGVRHIDRGR